MRDIRETDGWMDGDECWIACSLWSGDGDGEADAGGRVR